MPTTLAWSLFTLVSIVRCIICTIIIYYGHKFYKHRHQQPLQKRFPPLVYLITICVLIFIGLDRTFLDLSYIYGSVARINLDHENQAGIIFKILASIFYSFSLHGAIAVMISRAYIVYFNINFGLQVQKQKWVIYIDPKQASSFWFIKHKKDYGSYKFIKSVLLSYYFTEAILLLICFLFIRPLLDILDFLFFLIEIISLIIIRIKIPSIYDGIGLKQELRYVLYSAISGLSFYIVWIGTVATIGYNEWSYFGIELILSISTGAMAIIFNSFIFVSKYKYLLKTSDEMYLIQTNKANDTKHYLSNTLINQTSMEAFLEHLSDEFSVELLLSFIEFKHFKQCMENDCQFMNDIKLNEEDQMEHNLCDSLPLSYIVFEKHKNMQNGMDKYVLIANDLFDKYIHPSSEFEINISYDHRQAIIGFMNGPKTNKNELYTLYDNCIYTVLSLMSYSHGRFTDTQRFAAITK